VNDDSNATHLAREKWELARRDFLIMGSAAMAGVAVTSLGASTLAAAAAPAGAVLSVGFADGIEAGTRLAAAQTVRFADRRFLDAGARVTVHGASQSDAAPSSIRLSVFFPQVTEEGRLPLLAFASSVDAKGHRNTGSRVSFVAPLDADGMLPLALERVDLTPSLMQRIAGRGRGIASTVEASAQPVRLDTLEQRGNVCRLSAGGDHVGLRAGTYFVALRRTAHDRVPNWSAIAVGENALDLRSGGRAVGFEYVAVSIDPVTI
jgi:hypothetical protein